MNSALPPDSPKPDRTLVILFSVLIVTLALLFVIAGLTWAVRSELVGGPTSTPTATQRATIPPTPDFRATRFIQDALTKEAYEAVVGPVTPIVVKTQPQGVTLLPIVGVGGDRTTPTASPVGVPGVTITPTVNDIHLPVVSNPNQAPTATVMVLTPETPAVSATPIATMSPTPPPSPTFTPTFTPQPNITPSPVAPTPTATPSGFSVAEMRARVTRTDGATVRVGPSTIYSDTGFLNNGAEIILRGRTESGEWVYGCCVSNDEGGDLSFWVRQADAPPADNNFGDAVPTGEPTDDVRWLGVQTLDPTLTPMPSPTVIPSADYPLYRRDPSNQARVSQLPRPPITLMPGWPYQAAQEFLSPVVVGGNNALAHSRDVHLYSIDRTGGNQRWKTLAAHTAQKMPAIVGENVYLVDDNGVLYDFALPNGELRWQVELNAIPAQGVNIVADNLLLIVRREDAYWLMLRAQEDGDAVSEFELQTSIPQYPAVGDQLVYIANNRVLALDVFDNLTQVWTYETVNNATAPPLYIRPGVRAAAELYVADENNRVISLDANTGRELWVYQSEDRVTGLAADETRLYLTGDNFVKAISRRDHADLWRELSNGSVLGGPVVGDGELLTLTENGDITYWNVENGDRIYTNNDVKRFSSAGAVAGGQIYIIGEGGMMYGFQGGGQ